MEIKVNEIYAFKLTCGQEIVAKVESVTENGYNLFSPLTIIQGKHGMEFAQVMFTGEPLADAFLHDVGTALVLPCRADIKEVYEESLKPKSDVLMPFKKAIITG